jgi:hypothetical protein
MARALIREDQDANLTIIPSVGIIRRVRMVLRFLPDYDEGEIIQWYDGTSGRCPSKRR